MAKHASLFLGRGFKGKALHKKAKAPSWTRTKWKKLLERHPNFMTLEENWKTRGTKWPEMPTRSNHQLFLRRISSSGSIAQDSQGLFKKQFVQNRKGPPQNKWDHVFSFVTLRPFVFPRADPSKVFSVVRVLHGTATVFLIVGLDFI